MSRTQLRLGQVTGSFGSSTGQINQGETKSSISAMTVDDLSDVLGHMASAIKRIHGAGDFSNQDEGVFSHAITGSAGVLISSGDLGMSGTNIINAGVVELDSISAANSTDLDISLAANQAAALEIKEGSNVYLKAVTSGGSESLELGESAAVIVKSEAQFQGNVDLGDATSETVTFVARVDSSIEPDADESRDLGASARKWKESHIVTGSFERVKVDGLTDNRVLIAGASGEIEDDANLTYNGTILTLGGNVDLDVGRDATVGRNLTVTGDFTVNGTTSVIDTTNLRVEDPVILLGSGSGGDSAGDRGLLMNIAGERNPAMFWDETSSQFAFVRSDADGNTNTITPDEYADLKALHLTASAGLKVDGGGMDVTGEAVLASATVSDLTSGRVVFAGTGGSLVDDSGLTFIGGDDKLIVAGDVQGSAISGSAASAFQLNGSGNQQILKTTAGNLGLKTSGANAAIGFADSHFTGSSHSGTQLPLATDVDEYNKFVSNFGNASIIDALNQARSGTPNAGKYNGQVSGAAISAGTDFRVTGFDRSAMTTTQLVERVDVFVNGQLLLTGSSSGATARDYHFTGVANNDAVKFTFALEVDDVVSVIVR